MNLSSGCEGLRTRQLGAGLCFSPVGSTGDGRWVPAGERAKAHVLYMRSLCSGWFHRCWEKRQEVNLLGGGAWIWLTFLAIWNCGEDIDSFWWSHPCKNTGSGRGNRSPVSALLLFSDPNQKLLARELLENVLYTGELRVEQSVGGMGRACMCEQGGR